MAPVMLGGNRRSSWSLQELEQKRCTTRSRVWGWPLTLLTNKCTATVLSVTGGVSNKTLRRGSSPVYTHARAIKSALILTHVPSTAQGVATRFHRCAAVPPSSRLRASTLQRRSAIRSPWAAGRLGYETRRQGHPEAYF